MLATTQKTKLPKTAKLPKKKMSYIDRKLTKGLGEAVAKRTYLRTDKKGNLEPWADVAKRVAKGVNVAIIRSVCLSFALFTILDQVV